MNRLLITYLLVGVSPAALACSATSPCGGTSNGGLFPGVANSTAATVSLSRSNTAGSVLSTTNASSYSSTSILQQALPSPHDVHQQLHGFRRTNTTGVPRTNPGSLNFTTEWQNNASGQTPDLDTHGLLPAGNGPYTVTSGTQSPTGVNAPYRPWNYGTPEFQRNVYDPVKTGMTFSNGAAVAQVSAGVDGNTNTQHGCRFGSGNCEEIRFTGNLPSGIANIYSQRTYKPQEIGWTNPTGGDFRTSVRSDGNVVILSVRVDGTRISSDHRGVYSTTGSLTVDRTQSKTVEVTIGKSKVVHAEGAKPIEAPKTSPVTLNKPKTPQPSQIPQPTNDQFWAKLLAVLTGAETAHADPAPTKPKQKANDPLADLNTLKIASIDISKLTQGLKPVESSFTQCYTPSCLAKGAETFLSDLFDPYIDRAKKLYEEWVKKQNQENIASNPQKPEEQSNNSVQVSGSTPDHQGPKAISPYKQLVSSATLSVYLNRIGGVTPGNLNAYTDILNKYMNIFDINTPMRISAFLGQLMRESEKLSDFEEDFYYSKVENLLKANISGITPDNASKYLRMTPDETDRVRDFFNTAYGRKNGNINDNDGYNFRGRGAIMVTGRSNYQEIQNYINAVDQSNDNLYRFIDDKTGRPVDIMSDPNLLGQPEYAIMSAAIYWTNNRLNELADKGNYDAISRVVNRYDAKTFPERKLYSETAYSLLSQR